mmetsp:Transcript_37766/g.100485  ORF Transcript_37766/g.100485 Transcript_37766/m.100485 type:complete len:224 (-) Transcript_37766:331-1002(-)|eukprot:CAMPEP_0194522980 /NCGR_PEP_ID=MMETSP0253-20130528/57741_1 /TAXON_ID=2966 /ORGANISM="Noctiluca scintillans" /LENGTH=223 /DNA_ID=CAMNT_0039367471 /DNA_START=22 /DNA_END=693 /DNA_ORIENTATION=-
MFATAQRRLWHTARPVARAAARPRTGFLSKSTTTARLHARVSDCRHASQLRCFCSGAAGSEEEELAEIRRKISEARELHGELDQKLALIKDDAWNAQKRHSIELENETKYGITKFALEILKVADNLERAVESVKPEEAETDAQLRKMLAGVKHLGKTVAKALEEFGIEKMDPMDKPFDPSMHEAMFAVNMPGKEADLVFHVMEPGYTIHDRCLKAAKVGVTRA